MKNNILIFLILNIPKINLINIPGYAQGLRFEDFFIFIFIIYNFINRRKLKLFEGKTSLYFIISLLSSALISSFTLGFKLLSFIFVFRWIEYFLLFYVISYNFKFSLNKIFKYSTIFQLIIVLIQLLITGSARPPGTFNGPWELATIFGFITIFFINKKSKFFILSTLIIFLSTNRTTILFFILYYLYIYINKKYLIFILLSSISFILYYLNDKLGLKQFMELVSNFIKYVGDELIRIYNGNYSSDIIFKNFQENFDGSLSTRIDVWFRSLNTYLNSQNRLLSLLFGIGPARHGIIIDGLFPRLILEFGLISSIFAIKLFIKLYKVKNLKHFLIFLLFTGLTIDPLTSIKIFFVLTIIIYHFKNETFWNNNILLSSK